MEKSISTIEQKLSVKDKGAPRHIVIKQEAQPPFEVVSPKKLKERMQADLKEALRRCKKLKRSYS